MWISYLLYLVLLSFLITKLKHQSIHMANVIMLDI
jgi:hypothetical protein